jgi:hypothetical protein
MLPLAFDLRAKIALAITEVLASHGILKNITWEDIAVTPNLVTDGLASDRKISSAIIAKLWPSVHAAEVYHYTSRDNAKNILSSNRFRLTNIGKRVADGEIKTFCETHQLKGYLAKLKAEPEYKTLIEPNTYYASFTDTNLDKAEERSFWEAFGPVRLRLKITAQNENFRRMYYERTAGAPIPVLLALANRLRDDFGRAWILQGLSSICSFYLTEADYGWEKEKRVLWRVWDGSPCQPIGSGPSSYVELVLGEMSPCGFELSVTEVCSEDQLSVPNGVTFVRRAK